MDHWTWKERMAGLFRHLLSPFHVSVPISLDQVGCWRGMTSIMYVCLWSVRYVLYRPPNPPQHTPASPTPFPFGYQVKMADIWHRMYHPRPHSSYPHSREEVTLTTHLKALRMDDHSIAPLDPSSDIWTWILPDTGTLPSPPFFTPFSFLLHFSVGSCEINTMLYKQISWYFTVILIALLLLCQLFCFSATDARLVFEHT